MNCNNILNAGGPERGTLEKVADAILTFPRKVWLGKSVKIVKNEEGQAQVIPGDKSKSIASQLKKIEHTTGFKKVLLTIAGAFAYILSCIAAGICFAVGFILKKVAFLKDKKAELHAKAVAHVWQSEKLEANLKLAREKKELHEKKMEDMQFIIDELKDKPQLRDYLVVKNPEEVLRANHNTSQSLETTIGNLDAAIKKAHAEQNKHVENYVKA